LEATPAVEAIAPVEAQVVSEPEAVEVVKEPEVVRPPRRNIGAGRIGGGKARGAVETVLPSSDEFAVSRAEHWHQAGNPLLSIDGLKDWLNSSGLVQYAQRTPSLGAPAPTFVEATLGRPCAEPDAAELETARGLLARLIAEGAAVPLNLLGVTGAAGTDTPDFVCSAAVFSYIFTLRGNKAWKLPPVTAGPVKVSPLALATYEMLTAKVMLSSYDLATQLGKEVTEAAVLRSLTELWSQLRVIPVPQIAITPGSTSGHQATLWELTTARFTKQIKSGANAGQPTALSALISLYLGQARAAEESEIETFLSPLAARSRVRDVIHALVGARQLETLVIEGKTLLHITGEAPMAAAAAAPAVSESAEEAASDEGKPRISKFIPRAGSKIGTGLRSKPAGARPSFGAKPSFGRPPAGDRERRPFQREGAPRLDRSDRPDRADRPDRPAPRKPSFDKPWEENRPPRPAAAEDGARPARTFSKAGTFGRKREDSAGRPPFARRDDSGARPSRPYSGGAGAEGRPPRREFGARPERSGSERPAAGGFKRPGSYTPRPSSAPRAEEGGERREFRPKPAFGSRPAFGGKPAFGSRPSGPPRDRAEQSGGDQAAPRKVFRKFDAPRTPKPYGEKPGGSRSFAAKPFGAKPFGSRPPSGDRPERPARPFNPDRPPRPYDRAGGAGGDRPARPARPFSSARPSGEGRPPRAEGRPSFGARAAGGASRSPFAKFGDGKKPFRPAGPGARTGKPRAPRNDGGFSPVKRKRPEENE
jgi:hypothetical protein